MAAQIVGGTRGIGRLSEHAGARLIHDLQGVLLHAREHQRAVRARHPVLDGEAEALTRKTVALALDGDPAMLRLCFDRLMGKRRGRPVDLDLPPIETAEDLAAAAVRIADAAVRGAITPEEATVLCNTLERCGRHLTRGAEWGGSNWSMWLKKLQKPGTGSP